MNAHMIRQLQETPSTTTTSVKIEEWLPQKPHFLYTFHRAISGISFL